MENTFHCQIPLSFRRVKWRRLPHLASLAERPLTFNVQGHAPFAAPLGAAGATQTRRVTRAAQSQPSGQGPDFRFARLGFETRVWTILMLSLAVAVAGCAAVQLSTSTSLPPTEREAANVARDWSGRQVVEIAFKHVGTPYRWGGASPGGFDCSGFVRYVYSRVGVSLPHNAAEQYRYGRPVPRKELQPGDLVFFDRLRHNGIYIGNGKFIHSRQTGKRVSVARLDDDWSDTHWVGARRL